MQITWYGQTCFRLQGRDSIAIITDPYPPEVGLNLPQPNADIVTVSYNDPQCSYLKAVRGQFSLLDGPGEYEISGVFVTGTYTFADGKKGSLRGLNTIFTFEFDGLTVCHLGWLGHVPSRSQVEDLGTVDILLTPVGGGGSLTPAQASEVIGILEPSIVIPMCYKIPGLKAKVGPLAPFLKEMGLEKSNGEGQYEVRSSDLSEETRIVVLEPEI